MGGLVSFLYRLEQEVPVVDAEKERVNKNSYQPDDDALDDEKLEDVGDIRIADEVISIVASLAAQEVPGVVSMSGGLSDGISRFIGKENTSKGVRLRFEGKLVNASVYVNIEYGCCIPEIALEIQEKVKDAIEAMTGYEVQFVDVHVEGVAKREATVLEREEAPEEAMADIVQAQKQAAAANEVNSFEAQLANLRKDDKFALPPEEEMDERHAAFFEED